ncbi:class I SAM-dependent RNA methyltransferase [Rhodococcus triatomae]|uniref:tRNA/tmRNA/rRNA uracil-C5-methylase, TrmA/RlmC/RlmD family n=1 Tax=Rhodococcus triatomae TaxID=300028 RepID=A0A1G8MND1_9NOCA|nr:TRAM domain-containing protein [Rhodococcus triatomae]QNG19043.1 class I SAM-dependent RNA methyltransferase [Rhodococcus triatomae]QNG25044.1 class I SAM-dependent RNA methyltransferase [Rhodococcus triatomae]SDI69424.1 tRNA/tmRNA/rRNA uracil-C5-methylase, TrmA/RlmC/RlmD family [Rhodococcus triatomae]
MSENWTGRTFEADLGRPGHGGFVVARHDGRVVFVRHGLPGERVRVRVTEDRGGSFARADAVEVLDPSPLRIDPLCPVSGPGGAGCCDFSHAALSLQREMKAEVVAEQLRRVAGIDRAVPVEELPGTGTGTGWRTRVRLAVDGDGRPGYHGYRSADIVTDLRCPQIVSSAYDGLDDHSWRPGSELQVVVDDDGARHVVEIAAPKMSRTGRASRGRRGATARRAAGSAPRRERVVSGSGRAVERVGGRRWELSATGFWQAHRSAAETYSTVVREWARPDPGAHVWDLYGGVGVFAAVVAGDVGPGGRIDSVEFSATAVRDGAAALADAPQVHFHAARVERAIAELAPNPQVVILDPPRSGAGKEVVAAVSAAGPQRIVHVGCDPASFARDLALYSGHGYHLDQVRAFDAFPLTHHVECLALLVRGDGSGG